MDPAQNPILITGAGIGGLSCALSLMRAGHKVEIYEQAQQLTEAGAGLQLSPNATRVLWNLGLEQSIMAHADRSERMGFYDSRTGAALYTAGLGADIAARHGFPYLHCHRQDLLNSLKEAVEAIDRDAIHLGCDVVGIEQSEQSVCITFAGGTSRAGAALIGADGLRSMIRKWLLQDEIRQCDLGNAGTTAYRALVPADCVNAAALTPETRVWAGPGRHFVHYPLRGGSVINVIAVIKQNSAEQESWGTPANPDILRKNFGHWPDPVAALVAGIDECLKWPLYDHPPLPFWSQGKITLLGDAAHPMLPFMAQGAAQAIEDAAVLTRALAKYDDYQTAFQNYQRVRLPRTAAIQSLSRRNQHRFHASSPAGRFFHHKTLKLVTRLAPKLVQHRLDQIYGYDVLNIAV